MVTCESCFHYEACKPLIKHCNNLVGADNYQLPFPFKAKTGKKICKNFKDKSLIWELLVKPGDTVYIENRPLIVSFIHSEPEITYVVQFDCDDCGDCPFYEDDVSYEGEHDCKTMGYLEFTENDIGKSVFLTREEAEKHLNSLQRNEGGEANG